MTPSDALKSLVVIRHRLASILTTESSTILQEVEARVRSDASDYTSNRKKWRKQQRLWGYVVSPDRPIEFRGCKVRNYDVHVDLHCSFKWKMSSAGTIPTEQNLVLRVWSSDSKLIFRQDWDSQQIQKVLEERARHGRIGKRVMLRYHFDLANPRQPGPRHHFQVGGIARDNELCWLPSEINLPRLPYPPMDLALACEMITANFYPNEYRELKNEPEWRRMVLDAQSSVLEEYFRSCHENIRSGNKEKATLLEALWQPAN